jgi:organic radical activating enzyme
MSKDEIYRVKKLEYNISHQCNLKCHLCDHLSPYFSNKDIEFDQKISLPSFCEDLHFLARYLHCDEFLILGGEPLLNPQACSFLAAVKESGIASRTVLVTNGFLLAGQDEQLFRAVDKISITLYPSVPLKQALLTQIEAKCAQSGVELEINRKPKFMVGILGSKNEAPDLVNQIFSTCSVAWKNRCFVLHDGYLFRCSRAPFAGYRLAARNIVPEDFSRKDGLKIEETAEFPARMRAYFESALPLQSCSYCLGSVGKQTGHRQLTRAEIEAESWVRYDARNSISRLQFYTRLAKLRLFNHA